ncbi:hypothetical protein [Spongiimicrobium salis]|uniref:hypothetical protein n=1 Tax=Spongiimicrobium salis TaxID=1667022 RepID=UPI00374D672B
MKRLLAFVLLAGVLSCKETPKEEKIVEGKPEMEAKLDMSRYPEALQQVFEAHGGLDTWKSKKSLAYELPKGETKEIHTTNLYSRKDRVDAENFTIGYDGKEVWLLDENKEYKGDAIFYHNLYFYFYAMPFVVADDGIVYSETEDLEFEGKKYPGVRIAYNDGVGASPKDEYFVHYDPETHQMAWLGYTVTYRSGEKSDRVSWIRYNDWKEFNDVVLPNSISWYTYEGRTIKELRNTVTFENVTLSEQARAASYFEKPEKAEFVKPATK